MTNRLRNKKKIIVSSAFTKSIIKPLIKKKENFIMRAMSIREQSIQFNQNKGEESNNIDRIVTKK